jgi:hypothetical protein
MLDPDRIEGLDIILSQAVEAKFVPPGTSKEKIAGLFQLQPKK